MQDIWKLEEHHIWSGIVYSDHNGKTTWRLFSTLEAKGASQIT